MQKIIQPLRELLLHGRVLWSAKKILRLVGIVGQVIQFPLLRVLRVPLNQLVRFSAHAAVRLHVLPSGILVVVVKPILPPWRGAGFAKLQQTASLHCCRSL